MILFLGNIIVTGGGKVMADRTRNPAVIAFAQHQVTLTDYLFTAGGAALVLATGVGSAVLRGMDYLAIRWLAWGFWLFTESGVLWAVEPIPVQIKQARLARGFRPGGKSRRSTGRSAASGWWWAPWRRWFPWPVSTGWCSGRYKKPSKAGLQSPPHCAIGRNGLVRTSWTPPADYPDYGEGYYAVYSSTRTG